MKKIFITGVSGTGKTTIANELKQRGVRAIGIDEVPGLCHWESKSDGSVVDYEAKLDREFIDAHAWICDVGKLKGLLNDAAVVLGMAENQNEFVPLFDKVLLLRCRPETFLKRIRERMDNVFGQDESAQKYILDTYEKFESDAVANGAIPIDAEGPVDDVIKKVLDEVGI